MPVSFLFNKDLDVVAVFIVMNVGNLADIAGFDGLLNLTGIKASVAGNEAQAK